MDWGTPKLGMLSFIGSIRVGNSSCFMRASELSILMVLIKYKKESGVFPQKKVLIPMSITDKISFFHVISVPILAST